MKKLLKAFSLTEIIIAMILSSTLLALAIKVILTITLINTHQNETSSNNYNIINIYTIINENFINSLKIETGTSNELIFINPGQLSTKVLFNSQGIIIKNDFSVDTINVMLDSLRISRLDSSTLLVKNLFFVIQYNNISYPAFFCKEYDNQILYNLYKNAD